MAKVIMIAAAVMIGAAAIYFRSIQAVPFAVGVLLTSFMNIAKLIMLEKSMAETIPMEQNDIKIYIYGQHALRVVMLVAVFGIAAFAPDEIVSIWGAVFGFFTLKIASYSVMFYDPEKPSGPNEAGEAGESGGSSDSSKTSEASETGDTVKTSDIGDIGDAGRAPGQNDIDK